MGQAIGQVLSFGVGVALSPVAIIAVVLMLATPDGRVNGLAFMAGWIFGLAAAGTILLLAASGAEASSSGAPQEWVSFVKIGARRPSAAPGRDSGEDARRETLNRSFRPG